jgi:hypothetical protein
MIKTNFLVTKEEKDRILNLHESATKKQYLVMEVDDTVDDLEISDPNSPTSKSDENIARDFERRMQKNPNFQKWLISVSSKYPKFKKRIDTIQNIIRGGGSPEPIHYKRLGRYLRKNPEIENQIEVYSVENPY